MSFCHSASLVKMPVENLGEKDISARSVTDLTKCFTDATATTREISGEIQTQN